MTAAAILAFERHWWRHGGNKEQAIREMFGLSPVRYYQRLAAVVRDPASLAIDAVTVRRLQRVMGRSLRAA